MNDQQKPEEKSQDSATIAVQAETLYLLNLLLFPGISFAVLAWLYSRHSNNENPVNRSHLKQTMMVSLLGALLIVAVIGLTILFGGTQSPWIWLFVIMYFTLVHSTLIFFGIMGLVKAMSGENYIFPLFGKWFYQE